MAEAVNPEALGLNYTDRLSALDTHDIRGRAIPPDSSHVRVLPIRTVVLAPDGYVAFLLDGEMGTKTIRCDLPGTVLVRWQEGLESEMPRQAIFELGAYLPNIGKGAVKGPLSREEVHDLFGFIT